MIAFLTSSPAIPRDAEHPYSAREVNGANGLIQRLAALWQPEMHVLFISAAPAEHEENLSRAAELGTACPSLVWRSGTMPAGTVPLRRCAGSTC
ncbi:MAG: hypothetical protein LUC87_03310 [Clostridiales bacterium]|nr:hypothetical protein [Clostridiales bacterium]